MRCENCGAAVKKDMRYCPACGEPVEEDSIRAGKTAAPSPLRRTLMLLVALVFVLAAGLLLLRELDRRSERILLGAGTASAPAEQSLTGRYVLLASSAPAVDGTEDWYIEFYPNGTGSARIFSDTPGAFSYTADKLRFPDGSSLDYDATDGKIYVYSGATLVFGSAEEAEAGVEESLGEDPGRIPVPSRWHGKLVISEHKGVGDLENCTIPVWGVIGETDEGQYFELYDVEDYQLENVPVLSFWCHIQDDHVVPELSSGNAWIFAKDLKESDSIAMTYYYSEGSISGSYYYRLGKESCRINFTIYPEEKTSP